VGVALVAKKNNPSEVLTIGEAANYLRVPLSSLYKLAQEGRIPCRKVGKHWRFHKRALDIWLEVPGVEE